MKKSRILVLQLAIVMLPAAWLLLIWNQVPERVVIHFDSALQPDGYGTKVELLLVLLLLMTTALGSSWLMLNLGKVDPKRQAAEAQVPMGAISPLMSKMSWTIVVFLSMLGGIIIYLAAFDGGMITRKYFVVLIALLMAALGNLMNNIKPNYFVGIRTPWNLSDETNWRKTHHLASRLWFFGGMLMAGMIIALPVNVVTFVVIGGAAVLAIVPMGYSWWIFKRDA